MQVSAAEAEKRFGGKWSEAEREMFEKLTAPANVEKTVGSVRRQLGERPATEIYAALREIEAGKGLSPVDEQLGLYAIFPTYTEGTHVGVQSPLSPALLMGEKRKVRGGDLPGGVRLTGSRMRDYVYHWRLTPTFEPVCLDGKAEERTAVVAAAVVIVEAVKAAVENSVTPKGDEIMEKTVKNAVVGTDGTVYAANGEWLDLDGFVEKFNAVNDTVFATAADFIGVAKYDGDSLVFTEPEADLEDMENFAKFMRTWYPSSVTRAVRQLLEEAGEDVDDLDDDEIDERDEFTDEEIDEKICSEYDGDHAAQAWEAFTEHVSTRTVGVFQVSSGEKFIIQGISSDTEVSEIQILGDDDGDAVLKSFEDEAEFLAYVVRELTEENCKFDEDFSEFKLVKRKKIKIAA